MLGSGMGVTCSFASCVALVTSVVGQRSGLGGTSLATYLSIPCSSAVVFGSLSRASSSSVCQAGVSLDGASFQI